MSFAAYRGLSGTYFVLAPFRAQTSIPALTPPAFSGGKGGSSPRDAGLECPFRRGVASVSCGAAATRGALDDQAEIIQAPRPGADGEDGRALRGGARGAPGRRKVDVDQ